PDLPALLENLRAALAMDRAVDAASAHERGVRGVHDRVDALLSDIPLHQDDPRSGQRSALLLAVLRDAGSPRTSAGTARRSRSSPGGRRASRWARCEAATPPGTAPSPCRSR